MYIPINAVIELTEHCNFNCIHCYLNHKNISVLSKDYYKRLIDDLYDLGCFRLTITGGEVFLYKDLLYYVLNYAKQKQFLISIITNCSLCDHNDFDILKSIELESFRASMYGFTNETYRNVCKSNFQAKNFKNNILRLKKMSIPVTVQTTVIKQNLHEIDLIFNWCKHHEIELAFSYVLMGRDGNNKNNLKCLLSQKEIKDCINKYEPEYSLYLQKAKSIDKGIDFCEGGRKKICISSDGSIYPCGVWRINIGDAKNDLKSAWTDANDTLKRIREYTMEDFHCCKCKHIKICSFCPGQNYSVNNTEKIPSEEVCEFTKILAQINTEG